MSTEINAVPLVFQGVAFDVIDRNGDPWLRGSQVASALGSTNPGRYISELYERNADEFTDEMTSLVRLQTEGGEQEVRIFSPRGCYALAMFARTDPAKAFRVWVMDVLESVRKTGQYNPKQTRIAEIDAGIFKLVEGVQKATSQLQEVLEMLLAERKELVKESTREQKRLATVQKKIQAKEDLDLTIAEVRQQELILALQVGKKGALRYQQETGIPMSTTLRDIQKVRLQGYDVRLFDGPFGTVYYLMVDGEPHSGLRHATAADYNPA